MRPSGSSTDQVPAGVAAESRPDSEPERPAAPTSDTDVELAEQARTFSLPAPDRLGEEVTDLWSTHYHLWEATEVEAEDGFVVLDSDDRPFPAGSPVHLTGRDWCMTALEGSGHVRRLDDSELTLNYSAQGEVHVECDRFIGASWRSQGRVRFGTAEGPYGDGVSGYQLVPFRTIAVDRDQATIPYGAAVFIPAAVGQTFEHDGASWTHDGWFFAGDTGGAIRDEHIDTFTGSTTDPALAYVTSSPDAPRFVAHRIADDHATARLLEDLHRGGP